MAQPRHADVLVPRWRALPQKLDEGLTSCGGFMSFFGEPRWGRKSVVEKGREAE